MEKNPQIKNIRSRDLPSSRKNIHKFYIAVLVFSTLLKAFNIFKTLL